MAKLRVVDGPLAGTEFTLNGNPAVAGRHIDCDLPIPDPRVSRSHAEFIPDRDGQYAIMDLGSANGTAINGILLPPRTPRRLAAGDELRMGQNIYRYFSGDARIPDVDIPGFVLEDILAEGGMGSICKARQTDTNQPLAIKILHAGYAKHEEFVNRFIQEARAAGRLAHPNIVKVFNVGKTANGRYYFTMELVKGSTLTQRIPVIDRMAALVMFMEIADALDYAHKRGIIHRDIKPDNILIGENGEAKLTDLGIAVLDSQDMARDANHVLGTPHYMSPEQASGKPIAALTDIYSLGAAFYHVFSGKPLFDAPSAEQIMIKHVKERPAPLADAVPDMPREFTAIVDRCLEKDPDKRFPNAAELRDALAKALDVHYPGLVLRMEGPGWRGRRLYRLLLVAAALLAAALLAALFLFS